jgi:hypothetical protein
MMGVVILFFIIDAEASSCRVETRPTEGCYGLEFMPTSTSCRIETQSTECCRLEFIPTSKSCGETGPTGS